MINELQHPSEAELEATEQLLKEDYFPGSVWLMSQKGSILYYMHGGLIPSFILFYFIYECKQNQTTSVPKRNSNMC
jgi:hypothetical protein